MKRLLSLLFLVIIASQWNLIAAQDNIITPNNADVIVVLKGSELLNKVSLKEMKEIPVMKNLFEQISSMLGQEQVEIDKLGINLDSKACCFLKYKKDGSLLMGASFEVNDPDAYKSIFMADAEILNENGIFYSIKEGYTRALRGTSGLVTYSVLQRNSDMLMNNSDEELYYYDDTEIAEYEIIEDEAYELVPEDEMEYDIMEYEEMPVAPEIKEDIVEVPPPPPPVEEIFEEGIHEIEEEYDYEAERTKQLENENNEMALVSKAYAIELFNTKTQPSAFSEDQINSNADFTVLVNNYGTWINSLTNNNNYYRSSLDVQMEQWLTSVYGNVEWVSVNGFYDKDALRVEITTKASDFLGEWYSGMLNKEFKSEMINYIPFDEHLMFTAGSFNTEEMLQGYYTYSKNMLEEFPTEIGGNEPVGESISILLDFIEMIVDESALNELMRGDYYAGITNISTYEVEYTDYEYDDDFNFKEVIKTKEEVRPDFLCMFSSNDTKNINNIFKLISLASEGEFSLQEEGYYKLSAGRSVPLDVYALQKEGIVFVFTSQRLFDFINDGGEKPTTDQKDLVKSNSSILEIKTSKIAETIPATEFPQDMKSTLEFLEDNAGDVQITSGRVKNNMLTTEINLMANGKHKNSLAYVLSLIDSIYSIDQENHIYRN